MKILLPIIKIASIFLRYNISDFSFLLSFVYSNFSLPFPIFIFSYPLLLFIPSNPPPQEFLSPLLPPVESVFHNSAYI